MKIDKNSRWNFCAWLAGLLLPWLPVISAPVFANSQAAFFAPEPDAYVGDGRVSAFYHWREAIPRQPGQLLRSEILDNSVGLPAASEQHRILFTSTDGVSGSDPIAVSGAVFIPPGKAPDGGWPVVAWGHGTLGVADICAPSWQGRSLRDVRYLNSWLEQGFAVVASDYQGIGVPGFNPQFNNRSNAWTILDSVRAARHQHKHLSNKILLVGQSQGGSAVVVAAGYAKDYAPELQVLGTIGTGIVYTSPADVGKVRSADPARQQRFDPSIAYGFYHVIAAEALNPALDVKQIYTDEGLLLLHQARSSCLAALTSDVSGLQLTPARTFRSGDSRRAYDAPADDVGRPFPTVALAQPLFIGVGEKDGLVSAGNKLAADACSAGTSVHFYVYPDHDHSSTVNTSLKDSLTFAKALLRGEIPASSCDATSRVANSLR